MSITLLCWALCPLPKANGLLAAFHVAAWQLLKGL